VRRWQDTVRRDDVRFLVSPTDPALWAGPSATQGRVARTLLGVDDDLRFRHAEQLFVRGHVPVTTFEREKARLGARGSAVAILDGVAEHDAASWRRARASTFLALLAFEDAQGDAENGPALVRRALALLSGAAREDGLADDAKYDLEVLLSLQQEQERQGREPGGDQEAGGGVGAGAATAGGGY
jgi:hypothetical protein